MAAEAVVVRAAAVGGSSERGEAHRNEEEEEEEEEGAEKKTVTKQSDAAATADVKQEEEQDGPVIQLALALLRFYRTQISPLTPPACRFVPTCSQYSMTAGMGFIQPSTLLFL